MTVFHGDSGHDCFTNERPLFIVASLCPCVPLTKFNIVLALRQILERALEPVIPIVNYIDISRA